MTTKKTFALRVDPQLFQAIEAWAAEEYRSVNSQIEYLLNEALKREKKLLESKIDGKSV